MVSLFNHGLGSITMAMTVVQGVDPLAVRTVPISSGGQISLPAEIRRRWGVETVQIVDLGEHLEIRPVPGDPIRAMRGALTLAAGATADQLRAEARSEDRED